MALRMNLPTLTPTPRQTCAVGTAATCPRRVDRHETDSHAAPILNVAKDNQLSIPTGVATRCGRLHRSKTGSVARYTAGRPA